MPRPCRFTPRNDTVPTVQRLSGPQGRCELVRKITPPGFDPRIAQPVASRYFDYAITAHVTGTRYKHEICTLLGYYEASNGKLLPTFRDSVSVPSSRVKVRGNEQYKFKKWKVIITSKFRRCRNSYVMKHVNTHITCKYTYNNTSASLS
jgi:hypothetical protein